MSAATSALIASAIVATGGTLGSNLGLEHARQQLRGLHGRVQSVWHDGVALGTNVGLEHVMQQLRSLHSSLQGAWHSTGMRSIVDEALQRMLSRGEQLLPHHEDSAECFVREMTTADPEWMLKTQKGRVCVWRRRVGGSTFDMVRGSAVLDVKPSTVVSMLDSSDEHLIRQYNPLYHSGWDLEHVDRFTKVSYARVRSFPGFRPRDTVTRISRRPLRSGGMVYVLSGTSHQNMPPLPGCVRAKILSGMHLSNPVTGNPGQTNYTFTMQINLGGILPAWLINTLVTRDCVDTVERIERVAKAIESKSIANPSSGFNP